MMGGFEWVKRPPSGIRRVIFFTFSAFCHGIAYAYILGYYNSVPIVLQQLRPLVIASFLCAIICLMVSSKTALLSAHVCRLFLVTLAVAILESKNLILELLFTCPLLIDTTDRFHWKLGLIFSAFAIGMLILVDLLYLAPGGIWTAAQNVAILLTILISISVMSSMISRENDLLSEKSRRIKDLSLAVENLTNANKAFQDIAETIRSLSTEQERNRITRELHDLTGYALTNIIMLMNAGGVLLQENPEGLKAVLDNTKQQADSALREIRRILYQLRTIKTPVPTGLHAISQLARTFSDATKVQVSFNYGNSQMSYGEPLDEVIYRIIQVGLTNALRHGKARKVTIILWQAEDHILVSIGDDGGGSVEVHEGIGLKGIRERLSLIDGSLEVQSTPYGFELTARIPVDRSMSAKESANEPD